MPDKQEIEQEIAQLEQELADANKTEPALPAIVVTHPDVWDENGRLISHEAFTRVK